MIDDNVPVTLTCPIIDPYEPGCKLANDHASEKKTAASTLNARVISAICVLFEKRYVFLVDFAFE